MIDIDRAARRIMRHLRGWDARAMKEDRLEFPREHEAEFAWLLAQLDRIHRAPRRWEGRTTRARAKAISRQRRKT